MARHVRSLLLACSVTLVVFAAIPLASGNHPENGNASQIAILHKGGNEWWVEAQIVGYSKAQVTKVEARDDDSPWIALSLRSWGNWAGSFHIEPGHSVHFRATVADNAFGSDGSSVIWSCSYTHPAGLEQCGQSYPYGNGAGVVFFDHIGGDSNSVRLRIEPHGGERISGAYARVEGTAAWTAMQRGSETDVGNDWSASLAIPSGKRVQFEAYQAGGMSDVWRDASCLFTHPAGVEQCAGGPGLGMLADYSGVSVSQGSVRVTVASSKAVAGVDVRINPTDLAGDESSWIQLAAQGSGVYAVEATVPNQAYVEFRTRATDGSVDLSHAAWQAPDAILKPGAPGNPLSIEFRDIKGDSGWVQVNTVSNQPLWNLHVEHKAPGDEDATAPSELLTQHAWGDWARAMEIPPGHQVKFAGYGVGIYAPGGAWVESPWLDWPPTAPSPSNFTAAFSGVRGNEWWEQASVSTSGGALANVDVSLNGGTWKALAKQSWGGWAASYRAVEGTVVQFRATSATGATDLSDCYKWIPLANTDAAKTTCTGTPPPPPPSSGFDATFTLVTGNAYWVQSQVTPSSGFTVASVDVRLNDGSWKPLKLQSWGVRAWAASYPIPEGTVVQMRATATTSASDLSECYHWIPPQGNGENAATVACGAAPPPPPPSGFDATFTGVGGNDWWVQASVAANQPLAGVDVRLDCAPSWRPLTKQSWGGWAASFNIPAGSKVDFAARSSSGAADASGGYIWPHATATTGCAFGAWPQEGSFAAYDILHAMGGDGQTFVTEGRLNLTYTNGAWSGICAGRSTHNGETSTDWIDTVNGQPPMKLPAATSVGATHDLAYFFPSYDGHTCDLRTSDFPAVTVRRQEDRATSLQDSNGAPITLRAWVFDDPVEGRYVAAWDTKLGLVLDWDRFGPGGFGGDLVATDAPLR